MKRLMRWLASAFIGAGAVILLYCGWFYLRCYMENQAVEKQYGSIRESCMKQTTVTEETGKEIKESFGISWEKLWRINPDIKGWIEIPGAEISYPVVQGKDNEYYLTHSVEKKENPFGSIFLESGCQSDFMDSHTLVYGHNMEGQMMFANLNRYEVQEFLYKCPEFVITTPEKQFRYEIFSVEQAAEGSMAFVYGYEIGSAEYRQQLAILQQNSLYDTGVLPDEQKRMVSLVTCNSRLDSEIRMVIHGICREERRKTDKYKGY